ncbi:MAG: protein adenylyltransferase SelO family protein [Chakrabartia sp.]
MSSIPQAPLFQPARAIDEVADFLADPVAAADFPQTLLRFRNDKAAAEIGLAGLDDEQWVAHFGRFVPLPGSLPEPLALRYHGHQFRVYNPEIGDGRGFLFAQMHDGAGRLMDLGTKGSGQTPYSRFGDGRLTLKGAVREILATEMLEALGVDTSRTLSVIETGEALHRGDEPSPTRSAVLVRLSHGHIRIGSFQRLAALGETEHLKRLTAYALKHYYGAQDGPDAPIRLLTHVVARTAKMAASFMAAGFVHGVLNSDNINVSGESFDYGPWRWTPRFEPGFTAAYFDEQGLYAFSRQAEAIHWDVAQLANSFLEIADRDALIAAIGGFAPAYRAALIERILWRLGVQPQGGEADIALVTAFETALYASQLDIDRVYFDWAGGHLRRADTEGLYATAEFSALAQALEGYQPRLALDHPYWAGPAPCSMHIEEVEAIWDPIAAADDWSRLTDKVDQIRTMGRALAG